MATGGNTRDLVVNKKLNDLIVTIDLRDYGAGAAPSTTRRAAIDLTKRGLDALAAMGGRLMTLWLGQDGFDYSFQADYARQWDDSISAIAEVADHNPAIDVTIEYKPNEPRAHALMPDMATTLPSATGTDAHYGQAGKTTQDLSTGKGSGHNNLTYQPQAQGLQRADTIHLHRLNSKASHVGGGLLPIAVCQSTTMLDVPLPSGASPLPLFWCISVRVCWRLGGTS